MRRAALVAALAVVALSGCGTTTRAGSHAPPTRLGTSSSPSATATSPTAAAHRARLRVRKLDWELPQPIAREAVSGSGSVVTVAGGLLPGDGSTAASYTLDLRTGRATPVPDLQVPVHDTAGAVAGGRALVIGGGNAAEQSVVQARAGSGWTTVGHLPGARSDLSAVTVSGRVVVLGGYDGTRPAEPAILASADGTSWRRIGRLPVPVRYAASVVADGRIWLFGGERSGAMQTAIQSVDPATGVAQVVGQLARPLGHAAAVFIGGRILIVGGRTDATTITDRMWWFDPATRRVTRAGRLPMPLSDSAVASYGGASYLIGGESPGDVAGVLAVRFE